MCNLIEKFQELDILLWKSFKSQSHCLIHTRCFNRFLGWEIFWIRNSFWTLLEAFRWVRQNVHQNAHQEATKRWSPPALDRFPDQGLLPQPLDENKRNAKWWRLLFYSKFDAGCRLRMKNNYRPLWWTISFSAVYKRFWPNTLDLHWKDKHIF